MVKKFKDIVKQNPEPAKGKSGTDPMDPWGAKAGIAEASEEQLLRQYLKSRGINPEFVPVDTKIAHSKSGEFLKWRRDHEFTEGIEILEATDKEDVLSFDIPLFIRILELAREDVKEDMELHRITERLLSIRKKGVMTMDDYEFIAGIKKLKEEIEAMAEAKTIQGTALDKFRQAAAEREKKHAEIEKKQSKDGSGMTSAIDRLQKHLNKEEVELDESSKDNPKHPMYQSDPSLYKKTPKSMTKQYATHAGKYFSNRDKLDFTLNYKTTNKEAPRYKNEEVEQIDELNKTTLKSYRDKSMASLKNAKSNRDAAEPGKNMSKGFADLHAKSDAIAKKRAKGLAGYLQRKHGMKPGYEDERKTTSEEVELDEACSCETKKEWSKSARIIKNLYKKKNMKEETYDWEKDDKAQSYGKKPKIKEPSGESNMDQKKPEARIVMSGGTTLTGETRDEVQIDPLMKKPSAGSQTVFDKPNKK